MRFGRFALAVTLLLGAALGAAAQVSDLDTRAYRLGAEAAQAARSDPANAESIVAARYREALALSPDDTLQPSIKSATACTRATTCWPRPSSSPGPRR